MPGRTGGNIPETVAEILPHFRTGAGKKPPRQGSARRHPCVRTGGRAGNNVRRLQTSFTIIRTVFRFVKAFPSPCMQKQARFRDYVTACFFRQQTICRISISGAGGFLCAAALSARYRRRKVWRMRRFIARPSPARRARQRAQTAMQGRVEDHYYLHATGALQFGGYTKFELVFVHVSQNNWLCSAIRRMSARIRTAGKYNLLHATAMPENDIIQR